VGVREGEFCSSRLAKCIVFGEQVVDFVCVCVCVCLCLPIELYNRQRQQSERMNEIFIVKVWKLLV
jgi:hypothetical protein